MALKAWMEGDLKLAQRLLTWSRPIDSSEASDPPERIRAHQTRQAASPLWRWQIAS
jgi:hypothetical protein